MMYSNLRHLPLQLWKLCKPTTSNSVLYSCNCLQLHLRPKNYLRNERKSQISWEQVQFPVPFGTCLQNFSSTRAVIPSARTISTWSLFFPHDGGKKRPFLVSKPCSISERVCRISQYVNGMRHLEKLKGNDDLCKDAMRTGQYTIFYNLKALLSMDEDSGRMKLAWRSAEEMEEVLSMAASSSLSDAVLLNSTGRHPPDQPAKFALNIPKGNDDTMQQSLETSLNAQALGIRSAMFSASRVDITDLLQAYALLQWHSLQTFCSKCGKINEKNVAGSRRMCTNCSEIHYPTMKPIVITLVVDGERCLVARQPQFPDGMYSALAGFCDMGEALEDAVRREVAEEVGLEIDSIRYASSQHWPIPSSGLMLGCYANLKAGTEPEMSIDTNELEDAKWLPREEVQSILEMRGQSSLWLPPKQAIAHRLIRGWAFNKRCD